MAPHHVPGGSWGLWQAEVPGWVCCASSPHRGKHGFKQSEVLCACLYTLNEQCGASPLSLVLEELPVSPVLRCFFFRINCVFLQ